MKKNRWDIVKGRGKENSGGRREVGWPGNSQKRDRMFTVNKDGPTGSVDIYSKCE